MKVIDSTLLDELTAKARVNPRQRQNFDLHRSYAEPCQRLLNALEPESYIRPHRHIDPAKPETFIALRGRMVALLFDDEGRIREIIPFGPGGEEAYGVDVAAGEWHSILVFESGSVLFETKPGPYRPLTDKDYAPWAPAEGSERAVSYLIEIKARVAELLAAREGKGNRKKGEA